MTDTERLNLIAEIGEHFMTATEEFEAYFGSHERTFIGVDLAYLFIEIARAGKMDLWPYNSLRGYLEQDPPPFPRSHAIWQHVQLQDDA